MGLHRRKAGLGLPRVAAAEEGRKPSAMMATVARQASGHMAIASPHPLTPASVSTPEEDRHALIVEIIGLGPAQNEGFEILDPHGSHELSHRLPWQTTIVALG